MPRSTERLYRNLARAARVPTPDEQRAYIVRTRKDLVAQLDECDRQLHALTDQRRDLVRQMVWLDQVDQELVTQATVRRG